MNTFVRTAKTVAIIALLVGAATVSAQSSTTTRAENRAEVKQKIEERRDAVKAKVTEQRKAIIKNYVDRIVKRFNAAITRLENVAERIGTRLDKLATEGKDVTALKTKLDAAKTKIAEAKAAVAGIQTAATAALETEDPKAAFEAVRTLIKAAEEKIRTAHRALVDVINSIKPGLLNGTSTNTATSTATSTSGN